MPEDLLLPGRDLTGRVVSSYPPVGKTFPHLFCRIVDRLDIVVSVAASCMDSNPKVTMLALGSPDLFWLIEILSEWDVSRPGYKRLEGDRVNICSLPARVSMGDVS